MSCFMSIIAQSLSAGDHMQPVSTEDHQQDSLPSSTLSLIATIVLGCIAFICACFCMWGRGQGTESGHFTTNPECVPLAVPEGCGSATYSSMSSPSEPPATRCSGTLSTMSSDSSAAGELANMCTRSPASDRRDAGGYSLEEQLREIETELGWKQLAEQQRDPAQFVRCLSAGPCVDDTSSGSSEGSAPAPTYPTQHA